MRLSVVIPSNRDSLAAYARIMQAASWATADVEVIVRDNSGSPRKRAVFGGIEQDNCRIIFAEPCDINTNFQEALDASTGDFVLLLGDDDAGFDRGIAAIAAAAIQHRDDLSVSGLTGGYALEQTDTSHIVSYPELASPDVAQRVNGYLGYQGPNLIFYSAIRRPVLLEAWAFIFAHPFRFSFHDHFFSLIYLLSGRFVHVNRLAFIYDNANWEVAGVGTQNDLRLYTATGMDPAIRKLHWLLCGFEGAGIILLSRFGQQHALAQRQALANRWFEVMFRRFVGDANSRYDSSLMGQADKLHEKWRLAGANFTLEALLADICDFIRLFSPEKAQLYHDFWTSLATPAAP